MLRYVRTPLAERMIAAYRTGVDAKTDEKSDVKHEIAKFKNMIDLVK
jgi:hypothetical protein